MNKYGMNLVQLATEIMRRAESKRDFVAETTDLVFGENALAIDAAGRFPLTDHAHGQIADRVGIPKRYYDRMRAEAPALLADNVNHWFREQPERRMVRTLDGKTRAFLSDRYHRIDNEQIADAVLPVLLESGGHGAVVSCCVTEAKLYIQALFPRLEGEVRRGDPVQGGVIVSNGEIGNGALDIRPMIYRLVCTNGCISGQIAEDARLRRNHVGRRIESGEDYSVYSDETLKADDRALSLKIRDSIRVLAQPGLFNRILAETAGRHPTTTRRQSDGRRVGTRKILFHRSGRTRFDFDEFDSRCRLLKMGHGERDHRNRQRASLLRPRRGIASDGRAGVGIETERMAADRQCKID